MLRRGTFVLAMSALILAGLATAQAVNYTVTDLGIAASGTTNTISGSFPLSVNNSGQVVGYLAVSTSTNASERRAAYYNAGTWVDIGDGLAPGNGVTAAAGKPSMATCINNNGLVSGWYIPSGLTANGVSYLYQIGSGATTYLSNQSGVLNYANYGATHSFSSGPVSDSSWKKWTNGGGLNDSGTLVGSYSDSSYEWGFKYDGSSTAQIPLPSGYQLGVTNQNYYVGINAAGVIIAQANIYVSPGLPGMTGSGYYINTDGTWHTATGIATPTGIAGNYIVGSSSSTPFTGSTAKIGVMGASSNGQASGPATTMILSGDLWSLPTGVTTTGVAVGVSSTTSTPAASSVQVTIDNGQRAFVYDGAATVQLSTLVQGSNPFSNLQAATAISNNGNYIVGYGPVGGVMHGFLLSAVPEPSTLLLIATGLVGLVAYAWRKRR